MVNIYNCICNYCDTRMVVRKMKLEKELKAEIGQRVYIPIKRYNYMQLNHDYYEPVEKEVLAIIIEDENYNVKYALDYDDYDGNYITYEENEFYITKEECQKECYTLTSKIEKLEDNEHNRQIFEMNKLSHKMWLNMMSAFIDSKPLKDVKFGGADKLTIRRFAELPKSNFDIKTCDICCEENEELIDTEGMVNGGVGEVCEQCLEDNDIRS